ncbi:7091_t:CDS:1, partial [Scutellospora calospora]
SVRGTEKSKVIEAIKEYFDLIDQNHSLAICALTGVATLNISSCTLHSLCGFGFDDDANDYKYKFSQEISKKTLQE